MHGDCCKYYLKMGMRYGVFNDGIFLGREREGRKNLLDFFALEKKLWNDSVHTRTMKIVLYKKDPRHQGLSEALAAGSIFLIVTDPPRRKPLRGRCHSSYQMDRVVTIPTLYLNTTSFVGKPHFIRSFSQTCSTDIAQRGMRQRRGCYPCERE